MVIRTETGAKITGKATTWENILSLPVLDAAARKVGFNDISTAQPDWYKLGVCAQVADMSKWVGVISWDVLLALVHGVIIRCGYAGIIDQRWDINRIGLKHAPGIFKGTYWYYNTGTGVDRTVDLILECLSFFAPGEIHMFALDIEKGYNAWESRSFRTEPLKIMNQVQAARPDITVVQYFNMDTWVTALRMIEGYLRYMIWYAWYPWDVNKAYPWTGTAATKVTMDNFFLWQYSADGNKQGAKYGVQSRDIDLNKSRDSVEEFYADWGVHILEPGEPPPPDNIEEWLEDLKAALSLKLTNARDLQLDAVAEIESVLNYAASLNLPLAG